MKIIRTLKITTDEFYDYLETVLTDQANAAPGHKGKIRRSDIRTGFQMIQGPASGGQNGGQNAAQTRLIITDYVRGLRYCAESRTMTDTLAVAYHTTAKEEGLEVVYEQSILGYEEEAKKKNWFLRGFSEAIYLSRMSNSLYDIQNQIIRKREGITEKKPPSLASRKEPLLYQLYKRSAEKKNR